MREENTKQEKQQEDMLVHADKSVKVKDKGFFSLTG
jgi:hypothetical protein